jgi:hypothetical protein
MSNHTAMEKDSEPKLSPVSPVDVSDGELILVADGPVLGRNFDLISACATGITTGNSWAVLGGGIVRDPPEFAFVGVTPN